MLVLEVLKENLFIVSMIFLIVSKYFLRKYYKVEDHDKKRGKKFHIISIIIYSIAVIFFLISFFEK